MILQNAKNFLNWQKSLAIGLLVPIAVWIYSRVGNVNPAILGDEYLYSINARKAFPWDPSPVGDFSNYLFNFVYQGTNLCGDAFYACAKGLNIIFFLGFVFTLFVIALRFIPFWPALGFMVAASLSPLSVYTSMFLPESMYMFFIGLVLLFVLRAISNFTAQNWAIAGALVGAASLVKPHAWLSAIAIVITLAVVGLGDRQIGFRRTLGVLGSLVAGAVIARIVIGLLVAGPKALSFFGQYLGVGVVEQVVLGAGQGENQEVATASPMSGVYALFGPQLYVHTLVAAALMAISIAAIALAVIEIIKTKKLTAVSSFALFAFIWFLSLMFEIVIFTGWVTGSGDDHSTRVLLRYYEFLYVIVPLAAIATLTNKIGERSNVFVRWAIASIFVALLTPAFTGFFSTLTIQIADAPTLAGLVVNAEIFNATAVIGLVALLVLATFPRYAAWAYVLLLPVTMVGTGWQIQDQYIGFRGQVQGFDEAGHYLASNLTQDQLAKTLVLAHTRFNATGAFFWADSPDISYELYVPGSTIDESLIPDGIDFVVSMDEITYAGEGTLVYETSYFRVYSRTQ